MLYNSTALKQMREVGFTHLTSRNTVADLLDICEDLGLDPNEVSVGYDKSSVYLLTHTAPRKGTNNAS